MSRSIFLGIDPTKNGLHLGHLNSIERTIRICKSLNYKIILLIGTFTSNLGDPSDKEEPRELLSDSEYKTNAACIEDILKQRISQIDGQIVYNHEWLEKLSFTEWMKLFGNISMNTLMKIDFFKRRIDNCINLPLREFMYFTLQSYDFYHLHKNYSCYGQAGGMDQRNNIIRGLKLIKNKDVKGYLFPLVKDNSGNVLSKTNMKENLFSSPINTYLSLMGMSDTILGTSSQQEKHILGMQIIKLYYNFSFRILYSDSFDIRDIISTLSISLTVSRNQIKKFIDRKDIILNTKNNRVDVAYKKLELYILNKNFLY